ncbi:hypothetical protein MCNF_34800 [Mycolicibacterium confluentis]|uniref:UDP-N-acetyl-D-mannosaminuronic acid transferase n=1 Tax=Mycolicibacterium confluentis TaxID=28047 RepID=A0A7I7XZR3_9MYCO|nr:hypothetical protein MCNF_34800 [Mycolicibacterium confluentis]
MWPRLVVGRVAVDLMDTDMALSLIMGAVSSPRPLAVASANLDHIYHFSGQGLGFTSSGPAAPGESLQWLTLLDGMPLVRKANSLSGRQWPRLAGSDLIALILERAGLVGAQVGFLGGMPETHRQLREELAVHHARVHVAGTWAPSRAELTDPQSSQGIAAEIRAAGVDILVVGLGKPLQENWISAYGPQSGADVLLAFGAVVDFLAGRIRRAPDVVAELGVEWAWRLMLEPRRLSRRYLVQGPRALLELRRNAVVVDGAL